MHGNQELLIIVIYRHVTDSYILSLDIVLYTLFILLVRGR